jgi:transcriptional regulator with XRE-family HTH domain
VPPAELLTFNQVRFVVADKSEAQMLVRTVIKNVQLPRRLIARDTGLSVGALDAWTSGTREPLPGSLLQLAAGLRRRAQILEAEAERLEKEAIP